MMTDNEIIKSLECCVKDGYPYGCKDCQYHNLNCNEQLDADALDLINRQKVEIERLERDVFTYKIRWAKAESRETKAKAEAIKEFAERLKEKAHTTPVFDSYCSKTYMGNVLKVYVADIDNLVKEMVGETNDE